MIWMNTCNPDPYGDAIDWNAIWMARKSRHIAIPGYREGEGFFQQKANVERFFSRPAGPNPRVERQLARLHPPAGTSVLDIGAGPGNLAVPLAARGCRVVAVEPAGPMREVLAKNASEAGVDVAVVPSAWEDLDPSQLGGPFDLVIASFSLSMVDIRAAIEKMHRVCSGEVHLYWFLTPPPWGYVLKALWPEIHGAEYHFEPLACCLVNVLFQMGLVPSLEPEPPERVHRYGSIEEAVDEFAHRMNCRGHVADETIRAGLLRLLREEEDGYILDYASWNAHVWWKTAGQTLVSGTGPIY
jgi:SAM-dependent methyltransferase